MKMLFHNNRNALFVTLVISTIAILTHAEIIHVDHTDNNSNQHVDHHPHSHQHHHDHSNNEQEMKLKSLHKKKRLELWARGDIHGHTNINTNTINSNSNNINLAFAPLKLGPIRTVRQEYINAKHYNANSDSDSIPCIEFECQLFNNLFSMRGGSSSESSSTTTTSTSKSSTTETMKSYNDRLNQKIQELTIQYGPEFQNAIQRNIQEHEQDCEISCQSFYCASSSSIDNNSTTIDSITNQTSFLSYNFGSVPPEDFADEFGFPLDIIKVSTGQPLFTPKEAYNIIQKAEEEGVDKNEYKSGKYKLGGDWLLNLPNTRSWFNDKLQHTFFPLIYHLFPEIVSSISVLRAHSVSLLKYNITHPRTDVHIDNGILAITVAMTPMDEYSGGGTFFEHMDDHIIHMDVGHVTIRPGSVRHGGHKVTNGTRYILGAFLLLQDRIEHVRRLKNRGSELRKKQQLDNAAKHFQWALGLNPKCTTCLKDWAEILMTQKKYNEAEGKIREALRLLENRDSDALFSLGVILSEAGKDDESIDAYKQSVELNADDAELCYNLGIKLGARGDKKGEMTMYAKATQVDPKFGGAWLNWGTTLAELGHFDEVSFML